MPSLTPELMEVEERVLVLPAFKPIIPVLAFCHRDVELAKRWLKWTAYLSSLEGGDMSDQTLVVLGTQRITNAQWAELNAELANSESGGYFRTIFAVCPTEEESGYPKSANHIFLSSLEHVEKNHPGHATLFIEPDTMAMTPDWFTGILAEYQECPTPFMGVRVIHNVPHATGVSVYPHDWRTQVPEIEQCVEAPDQPTLWGKGKGQAFDTFIGPSLVLKMTHCRTIQQIWKPGAWTVQRLHEIKETTKLFHQDKAGTLMLALAEKHHPEFLKRIELTHPCFILQFPSNIAVLDGRAFVFTKIGIGPGGISTSVYQATDAADEMILRAYVNQRGISEITPVEYARLLARRRG